MGQASRGDVCPAPPSSGVVSARAHDPAAGPLTEEEIDYVGFVAETGSVSKMAIVRRRVPRVLGRYLLGDAIAAGGMATVHLGRLIGPAGFSRTVAVKRLHGHLATNPEFVQRFVDEARIASRVRHTNVVQTLDVVSIDGELLLVLDYVHGESFARLRRLATAAGNAIPPPVASGILGGVLRGLHAAHEAKSNRGVPLDLVHRDVTPQNILVGADGVARVLDFGIARATGHSQETLTRDVKGKLAYMPPEQVSGGKLDRRTDVFAAGVVLWEALAGERLFRGEDALSTIDAIYNRIAPRLADRGLRVGPEVDDVLARALAKDAASRFESADAMARAVEAVLPPASDREIAEWVGAIACDGLAERLAHVARFESDDRGGSKARLYAASPPPPDSVTRATSTTKRRDALMPPPLSEPEDVRAYQQHESVTCEAATPRRNPRLCATSGSAWVVGHDASTPAREELMRDEVSQPPALMTPLVLITSASPAPPSSGHTRVGPVVRRAQVRTPVPIPFSMPLAKPRRAPTFLQLALLVVAPPLLVMAAVIGLRPLRAAADGAPHAPSSITRRDATESPVATPDPSRPSPTIEATPVMAPGVATPPAAAPVENENANADANGNADAQAKAAAKAKLDASAKAKMDANAKAKVRPPLHKPRLTVARPMPVAVNRTP